MERGRIYWADNNLERNFRKAKRVSRELDKLHQLSKILCIPEPPIASNVRTILWPSPLAINKLTVNVLCVVLLKYLVQNHFKVFLYLQELLGLMFLIDSTCRATLKVAQKHIWELMFSTITTHLPLCYIPFIRMTHSSPPPQIFKHTRRKRRLLHVQTYPS